MHIFFPQGIESSSQDGPVTECRSLLVFVLELSLDDSKYAGWHCFVDSFSHVSRKNGQEVFQDFSPFSSSIARELKVFQLSLVKPDCGDYTVESWIYSLYVDHSGYITNYKKTGVRRQTYAILHDTS